MKNLLFALALTIGIYCVPCHAEACWNFPVARATATVAGGVLYRHDMRVHRRIERRQCRRALRQARRASRTQVVTCCD